MHNRSHAHVEKNTLTSFVSCNAYLRSNIEDCDRIRNIIQRVKNMNALLFDIRILFLPGILIRIKKKMKRLRTQLRGNFCMLGIGWTLGNTICKKQDL